MTSLLTTTRRLPAWPRAWCSPRTGREGTKPPRSQATVLYAGAKHIIVEANDEKCYLYAGVGHCYDR